jgi:adenylylsulfate reductase subunit A
MAAKAAIAYILDHKDYTPAPRKSADDIAAELFLPYEIYEKNKTYSTDPEINPFYIKPSLLQARLQKIADEYFGGISTWYMTSETMLNEGLSQLKMLKEDSAKMGAADLHELMRCWENYHRILSLEAHARHILYREESRYPGYYYRGDKNFIDDDKWKVFTCSKYDMDTGEYTMSQRPHKNVFA